MWKAEKGISGGNIRLDSHGDPLIEKWEREIEQGIFPDLTEGLPPGELRENALRAIKRHKENQKNIDNKVAEDIIKTAQDKYHSVYLKAIKDLEFNDSYGDQ